uniref:Uncharacterized protein n=1 Tax=Ciona intestinalis TaxID=7719 RepID=H2XZA7_CIOIN
MIATYSRISKYCISYFLQDLCVFLYDTISPITALLNSANFFIVYFM